MSNIQIFENRDFGTVRTLEENGIILFCGADVARALGYSNPRDAVNRHCKGVVKRDTLTTGGKQELLFVPESDLYRLVFSSKLSTAEKFTDWVTSEVLPSIRKHGVYAVDEVLANPDMLIAALTELKAERAKSKALESTVQAQSAQIGEMKGKSDYFDAYIESLSYITELYVWANLSI